MKHGYLMFKAKLVSEYLVSRFTNDFDKRGLLGLSIKKTYSEDGYYIFFENKKIYYDFAIIAEERNVTESGKYLLGTFYIYLMNDNAVKNNYYILFLTLMKKLFEKQIEFNRYNKTTSPILISEINRYFSKNNIYIQT